MRPKKRKYTSSDGLRRLLALGFSKYRLAKLLDIHASTVSQWVRFERVGVDTVGRIACVPELAALIRAQDVRPDLPRDQIEASIASARIWARHRNRQQMKLQRRLVRCNGIVKHTL